MIIKELTIRNYRGIRERTFRFDRSLAVIPSWGECVLKAIGLLLGNRALSGPQKTWRIRKDTEISGKILLGKELFTVSMKPATETKEPIRTVLTKEGGEMDARAFFERIHESKEEERTGFYLTFGFRSDIMKEYRDQERKRPQGELGKCTEGTGETRVFKRLLRETISEQESFLLADGTAVSYGFLEDGSLTTEPEVLTVPEKQAVNLRVYLRVNGLWQKVEDVRDMHHERWPLFLYGLTEEGLEKAGREEWLGKAKELGRQIILADR